LGSYGNLTLIRGGRGKAKEQNIRKGRGRKVCLFVGGKKCPRVGREKKGTKKASEEDRDGGKKNPHWLYNLLNNKNYAFRRKKLVHPVTGGCERPAEDLPRNGSGK